jgi:glyoxylate utilization-related uncharacterized protein
MCMLKIQVSGMWCCVFGWAVPDVLKNHSAYIFKSQASKKNVFVVETLVKSKPVTNMSVIGRHFPFKNWCNSFLQCHPMLGAKTYKNWICEIKKPGGKEWTVCNLKIQNIWNLVSLVSLICSACCQAAPHCWQHCSHTFVGAVGHPHPSTFVGRVIGDKRGGEQV